MCKMMNVIFIYLLATYADTNIVNKIIGHGNSAILKLGQDNAVHVAWLNDGDNHIFYLDQVKPDDLPVEMNEIMKLAIYASTLSFDIDSRMNAHFAFRVLSGDASRIMYSNDTTGNMFSIPETLFNSFPADHPIIHAKLDNILLVSALSWFKDADNNVNSITLMTINSGDGFTGIDTLPFVMPVVYWGYSNEFMSNSNTLYLIRKEGDSEGKPIVLLTYNNGIVEKMILSADSTNWINANPSIVVDSNHMEHAFWTRSYLHNDKRSIIYTNNVYDSFKQQREIYQVEQSKILNLCDIYIDNRNRMHVIFTYTTGSSLWSNLIYMLGNDGIFTSAIDINAFFGYDVRLNGTFIHVI
jgi:hypothetical protein